MYIYTYIYNLISYCHFSLSLIAFSSMKFLFTTQTVQLSCCVCVCAYVCVFVVLHVIVVLCINSASIWQNLFRNDSNDTVAKSLKNMTFPPL